MINRLKTTSGWYIRYEPKRQLKSFRLVRGRETGQKELCVSNQRDLHTVSRPLVRVNNKNAAMNEEDFVPQDGDSDSEEPTVELPVPNDD